MRGLEQITSGEWARHDKAKKRDLSWAHLWFLWLQEHTQMHCQHIAGLSADTRRTYEEISAAVSSKTDVPTELVYVRTWCAFWLSLPYLPCSRVQIQNLKLLLFIVSLCAFLLLCLLSVLICLVCPVLDA